MPIRDEVLNLVIFGRNRSQQAFRQVQRSLDGIKRTVNAVAASFAGFLSGVGLAQAVRGIVDTNREFQSLKATLETFTGSASRANGAFKVLQDFAAQTPFDLSQLTAAFNRMLSVGLTPSIRALDAFGNVAAGSSKSIIQFVEAVADAAVGEFERLKEFGIKASKQGERISFTFKGVSTTVKNTAAAIEGFLTKIGQTEFAGAMVRQAKTLNGSLSNLRDSFDKFAVRIGEAGLNDAIAGLAQRMRELLGGSNGVAEAIGRVLASGVQSLGSIFEGVARGVKLVQDNSVLLTDTLLLFFQLAVAKRVVLMALAFKKFASAVRAAGIVMVAFQAIKRASITGFVLIGSVVAAAAGKLDDFRESVRSMWEQAKQLIPGINEGLRSALKGAGFDLQALETELTGFGSSTATSIAELDDRLRRAVTGLNATVPAAEAASSSLGKLKNKAKRAKDTLKSTADVVSSSFSHALAGLIDRTQSVSDAFRSMTQSILSDLARLASRQLVGGLLGSLGSVFGGPLNIIPSGLRGFATGGSFMVGGSGGTDSQVVGIRATPGERVDVLTPAQQRSSGSAPTVQVFADFRGAEANAVAAISLKLDQLIQEFPELARQALVGARVVRPSGLS